MKTEDLIRLLAEDTPVRRRLGQSLALALAVGIVASAVLLLATVGLRSNLDQVIGTVRVVFKISLTLALAATAVGLVARIGRPGASTRGFALGLAGLVLLVGLAVASELFVLPSQAWAAELIGHHAAFCLRFIPTLSLVPFIALMAALRTSAPEDPGRAGAAVGLASGAIGAALYAWHCPDDSPLFVATWYTLAIAMVTAAGYALGRRFLRW